MGVCNYVGKKEGQVKLHKAKRIKIPFRRYVIGKAVSDNKLTTVTENVVIRTITVHGLDGKIIQEIVDEYQEEE